MSTEPSNAVLKPDRPPDEAAPPLVLIVDDDPQIIKTYNVLLKKSCCRLEFAENGVEGIAKAERLLPDLILMDVMMPEMDGFTACEKLKSMPVVRKIPIIMVTALDGRREMARGLDAGADDFIRKPFNRVELEARMRSMLRIKRLFDDLEKSIRKERYLADLGRLAGSIAHDLNNINFAISGSVEHLMARLSPESQEAKSCERILSASDLMNTVVRGLTAYAGAGSAPRELLDCRVLAERTLDIFERRLRTVEVERRFKGMLCAWCNGSEIGQVLLNLIANALDAMQNRASDRRLSVRGWRNGREVLLSVSDTGEGIPEAVLPRIFDDLFTTKPQGTGIGLAAARKIIDAHNGRIDVISTVNKGTTVTIALPATENKEKLR